ncbi:hypothetical protein AWENTII_000599 [Aspergillus wentii]
MAAQAALIADTIVGMKRALRKEHDNAGPDDPITEPTNRGNKLRTNAKYVREGAMGYIHAEDLYKQKVEHAGYTRYILQPNPVRYDSEGDELDEDDEDSEADAAAGEENPFSEIALEHLLCPLKHPSELPNHPSMSSAYTSKALRNMTQAIEAKLRQERALLWRARNLHRQFLEPVTRAAVPPVSQYGQNALATSSATAESNLQKDGVQDSHSAAAFLREFQIAQDEEEARPDTEKDIEMADARDDEAETEGKQQNEQAKEPKSEEVDASVGDLPQHAETDAAVQVNDDNSTNVKTNQAEPVETEENIGRTRNAKLNDEENAGNETADAGHQSDTQEEDTDKDAEMQDGSSPEPPRRMTTRARANAANPQQENESIADRSPSPSTDTFSTLPAPHPLFLVPDTVRPDPNFGLPPNEAEDTRRLLWSYCQKQEETVRGFEHMLDCLLRACRMKEDVFEWCKAEGHAGEMSDGEDWYDREKWGLAEGEDLKKGADEDEIETVDESRATGKRGRGRRA